MGDFLVKEEIVDNNKEDPLLHSRFQGEYCRNKEIKKR